MSYVYGKKITISHNNVSADLTNFPCTVYLNDSNFDFTKCATSGDDIRFVDNNGNILKYECKQFITACSRINTTISGSDYIYYQKSSLITPANTTTLEVGLKIETSGTLGCQNLNIGNGTKEAFILVGDGFVTFNWYAPSSTTIYTNTTDKVHIYKIKYNNTTGVDYYMDGVLMCSFTYANMYVSAQNRIYFGDGAGSVNYGGSALYTYVTYCLDYVNNPNTVVTLNCGTTLPTNAGWTATISNGTIALVANIAVYNVLLPTVLSTTDTIFYVKCGDAVDIYNKSIEVWQDQTRKKLTCNGDVKIVRNSPTDHYANFDGTGDYFQIANTADFQFGTGNFTIEWWEYQNSTTANQAIINQWSGTNDLGTLIGYDGTLMYCSSSTTSWDIVNAFRYGDKTLTNQWVHRALVRIGTTLYAYQNGILYASTSMAGTPYFNASYPIYLGMYRYNSSTYGYLNGKLQGIKITKGRSIYTGAFTPPSKFVIDGSDVVFCTNFDSIYDLNYVMVQHMTDSLIDATGNNNNGTATGVTVVDDAIYGKVSNFISSSKITVSDSNSLDLTSNITLMAFTEYTNSINSTFMEKSSDNTNYQFQTGVGGTGKFEFRPSYVASPTILSTITCSDGVYRVFHGVQNGTSTKLYRDGTLDASGTYNPPVANTSPLTIGDRTGGVGITGKISEIRISNNTRSDSWIKIESLALKNNLLSYSIMVLNNTFFFGMNF